MIKCVLGAIFLIALACVASSQVQQSGDVTAGHPTVWIYNNVLGDAGPATQGALTGVGVTANSLTGVCQNSQPITQPYVELCLGTTDSLGVISLQGYGEATPPFDLCINGICTTIPPSSNGAPTLESVASLRASILSSDASIILAGYYLPGDGGGGTLTVGATGCTDNGGTIFQDAAGNCFYRVQSSPALSAQWFGAKCDAVETALDGSINASNNQFTSTAITFKTTDIGKVIEMNPGGVGVLPWRTTIAGVSGHTATLAYSAFNNYPGTFSATKAITSSTLDGGPDSPGSGYLPGDTLTATGGTFTAAATATVTNTGLVAITQTSGGSSYQANDLISLTDATAGVKTREAAVIKVLTVDGGGAVLTYQFVDYGSFQSGININPASFTQSSPHGSGFTFTLLASNGSFGVVGVSLASGGTYTVVPPFPANTTDSGTGTGATMELSFQLPSWIYGTDDTTALNAVEAFAEASPLRGIYPGISLPGGHTCMAQSLPINRFVSWSSSGVKQASLSQLLGATGVSINGSNYGFVVVAPGFPPGDLYFPQNVRPNEVTLSGLEINGFAKSSTVNINGTGGAAYTSDGLVAGNPVGGAAKSNVELKLDEFSSRTFPGNAFTATNWSGEIRGYDVAFSYSGGNCLDLEFIANPTRFYGAQFNTCTNYPVYLNSTRALEFHGVSMFGGINNLYVTGNRGRPDSYIVFDSIQMDGATNAAMYLDQSNTTLYCVTHCFITGANNGGASSGANDSNINIGPDASSGSGVTYPVLYFDGTFNSRTTDNDIWFLQSTPALTYCNCIVVTGPAARNASVGIPVTNLASQVTGPLFTSSPNFQTSVTALNGISIANPIMFATAPTISSGFGTSPSIVSNNGSAAFQVNVGTGGSASAGVIGLPTAAHGWAVQCQDVTHAIVTTQTASSTTTATVTGASAWNASDKLNCTAQAF